MPRHCLFCNPFLVGGFAECCFRYARFSPVTCHGGLRKFLHTGLQSESACDERIAVTSVFL